jgi:hypothetical protein
LLLNAGGVDAMDWAEMLERMYSRWAADHSYSLTVADRSPGEEAGIKGVELTIRGRWAYGYLKGALVGSDEGASVACFVAKLMQTASMCSLVYL